MIWRAFEAFQEAKLGDQAMSLALLCRAFAESVERRIECAARVCVCVTHPKKLRDILVLFIFDYSLSLFAIRFVSLKRDGCVIKLIILKT